MPPSAGSMRRGFRSSAASTGSANRDRCATWAATITRSASSSPTTFASVFFRHPFSPTVGRGVGGKPTADIVILEGAPASPTSIDRVRGFEDAISNFPDVRIVRKIRGDYLREPAKRVAHELLSEGVRFDAVLAANDEMGLGMISALDEAGVRTTVASVNAIPEAITAIKEGKLLATIDFNAKDIASIATEALLRHLRGESVPNEIMLPVQVVDRANCEQWDKSFEER